MELKCKKIIVNQKIRPPRYVAQITIWVIGLGISDIETQLIRKNLTKKSHAGSVELNSEL